MHIPKDALCRRAHNIKSDGDSCKYLQKDGLCKIALESQSQDQANKMPTLCTALSMSMHFRQAEQSKVFWQVHTAAD